MTKIAFTQWGKDFLGQLDIPNGGKNLDWISYIPHKQPIPGRTVQLNVKDRMIKPLQCNVGKYLDDLRDKQKFS